MHKLETSLTNFRFSNAEKYNPDPYNVTWYVLDMDEDTNENVRCFTTSEMDQFIDYVVKTPMNFFGGKNYIQCEDDEALQCGMEILLQNEHLPFPKNIVLRKEPLLEHSGIYSYRNVVLTDQQGNDQHTYNLNFNVVGRINKTL